MADRRRINGPAIATAPPSFFPPSTVSPPPPLPLPKRPRSRPPNELRKIFLKTALTPPATGSSFLELGTSLKLTCSVYGPRPLPPSAPFSSHARLTAELKLAPFSTAGARRGYVRDAAERDLSTQLQTALQRSVRTECYPKSGIDVFVTILDCDGSKGGEDVEMQALSGAITAAAAAIADAGIECVDMVSAGIAGVDEDGRTVLDPTLEERCSAKALVAYMAARDEVSLVWTKGVMKDEEEFGELVDKAVEVATQVRSVLNAAVIERLVKTLEMEKLKEKEETADVEMG